MADSKEKLFSDFPAVSTEQWMEKITADLKGADFEKKLVWRTNEGFKVKPFYRQEDLEGLKTTEGLPGEFPYVRGTKKNDNTWFVRQEIKVECPKEANAKALDILNKGVDSLGFYVKKKDLSPEYIETLLNDICAECIELNFSTCQGHTVELAKLLVAYFQKKGYDLTKLQGSVNYDPMGKMMVKGKDLSNFITTAKELVEVLAPLPKFRCICVNAIELNNAGSYISQELGYALAWGNEYLSKLVEAGVPAALVAKKIKFNFGISSNYFLEIAKFRAARMLWAKIVKQFNPKNPKSLALRTHSQTSGWSLTEQDPFNNVGRTCIEAMAAALGHTQSLHTNALDEAIALPTDFSARIARNTQIYIQEETYICKNVDPWGGSYYVESLTNELAHKAWEHIQEIEKLGGMAKAIETGIPKMRIEEAAARTQARIDSGQQTIVGVNKYRLEKEAPIDILEIDNTAVRLEQIENLKRLKEGRNQAEVDKALAAITECVKTGKGNLLELAVEAARVRATLGEISYACEQVVGRYKAIIRTISGVYSSESKNDSDFHRACELAEKFAKKEGRQPRIMVAKMGQDGHDRGAKVVATAYADMGFDVDVGPLFQTPAETAQDAVDNDVHIVGMSSLAAGHKTLLPQLVEELKKRGRGDIMVVAGGVIPAQDYQFLYDHGAACIFGPGTVIPAAAREMLQVLNKRLAAQEGAAK